MYSSLPLHSHTYIKNDVCGSPEEIRVFVIQLNKGSLPQLGYWMGLNILLE